MQDRERRVRDGGVQGEKPKKRVIFEPLDEDRICMKAGVDLTYEAQTRPAPALLGRDAEIRKALLLLCRRGARSFIITGEAGVGKSVLARELARRIVSGQAPEVLAETRIIQTSFMDLWATVDSKDNWPQYLAHLKTLIKETRELGAILFLDEIHEIFHHSISMSFLRPHLADGSLTIIGATTDHEYYTFLERDKPTARRFQTLRLEEPTEETTRRILESVSVEVFKSGDDLRPDADTLGYLVRLTTDYIPYQAQPAKSLNVLEQLLAQRAVEPGGGRISRQDVTKVVCETIGIPLDAITAARERLEVMEEILNAHVLGQKDAIAKLCRRLFIAKAGVTVTPDRPDGVFLLAGPTGVGKTELAKALAAYLTGDARNLVRLDMSSYVGRESIYSLIGTPGTTSTDHAMEVPLLTRELRTRPYTVLLLDEIEKAHPAVHLLFLQAFDTGRIRDNLGHEICLRRTVVILTSNVGFSKRKALICSPGQSPEEQAAEHEAAAMEDIRETFPAEFLGRIDEILFFKPLTPKIMKGFVQQKLRALEKATEKSLSITDEALELICDRGFTVKYGARGLNRTIDDLVGYPLARFKVSGGMEGIAGLRLEMDQSTGTIIVKAEGGTHVVSE